MDEILNFYFDANGNTKNHTLNWKIDIKDVEKGLFSDELKTIFDYEGKFVNYYQKNLQKIDFNKNLIEIIDLKTCRICPYCGRNYIFTIEKGDNKLVKPTIDHFYPKSKYPYIAIFPFNLIPSCYTCNSSCKGEKEIDFYPYYDDKDDTKEPLKFKRNLTDINNYDIEIETDYKDTVEVLKLKEFYNNHKVESDDLIEKSLIYNEEYIQELFKTGLITKDDIKNFILGSYGKENKEKSLPLYKFVRDIAKELGLL